MRPLVPASSLPDTVHGAGLEVHEHGPGHVLATVTLGVVHIDPLQLREEDEGEDYFGEGDDNGSDDDFYGENNDVEDDVELDDNVKVNVGENNFRGEVYIECDEDDED